MKRFCPVLLFFLAAVLVLPGCAFYGKRLEVGTIKKIVPGKTTRAEVERLLGPPRAVIATNNVLLTRHFFHEIEPSRDASSHVRRWHPGDLLLRTLTVRYGPNDIVERKLHDESVTPIYRTNAWYFAGPSLSADTAAFIARGTTTEAELIHKLGEPGSRTFDVDGRVCLAWFSLKRRVRSWSDLPVQRLIVWLDQGIVHNYLLDEYVLSAFGSDKARELN
jgi:hypothetical protein